MFDEDLAAKWYCGITIAVLVLLVGTLLYLGITALF